VDAARQLRDFADRLEHQANEFVIASRDARRHAEYVRRLATLPAKEASDALTYLKREVPEFFPS
jgi:hypothetical protein